MEGRWCPCCGSDDVQNYRCIRCGAELHEDGSFSYDPEEVKNNIEHYDSLREH